MRAITYVISLAIIGVVTGSGCRTATRVTEIPRVDLELEGGNRGYLVGTPPDEAELKTTRQILQGTIEFPSFYKPRRSGAPIRVEELAPPEIEAAGEDLPVAATAVSGPFDTYVVQKGDSLWSIAAKPEIYGKATQWRRIYDANREFLKSPDRVRAGMTLKIPRGEPTQEADTTYSDEGVVSRK